MEGEHLRQKILDEATELFVTQGFRGISMRQIAEKAGLSKAGLYYHFRDKEDLFLSILSQSLDDIAPLLEATASLPGTARERITHFVQGLLQLSVRERAVVRLASHEMIHVSRKARNDFTKKYQERFITPLLGVFEEGQLRGEIRRVSPQLATTFLLGICFPFLCRDDDATPFALPDEATLTRELVNALLDGLGADPRPPQDE